MRDEVSLTELATFFGLTRSAAQRLAREGLFLRSSNGRFDLTKSAQKYVSHLREIARNRSESPSAIATIRQKNAAARLSEVKAKRLSDELIEMSEAEGLIDKMAAIWRAAFLSLPQRIRVGLKLSMAQEEELGGLIDRRLNELAEETQLLDPLGAKSTSPPPSEQKVYATPPGPRPRPHLNRTGGNGDAERRSN